MAIDGIGTDAGCPVVRRPAVVVSLLLIVLTRPVLGHELKKKVSAFYPVISECADWGSASVLCRKEGYVAAS